MTKRLLDIKSMILNIRGLQAMLAVRSAESILLHHGKRQFGAVCVGNSTVEAVSTAFNLALKDTGLFTFNIVYFYDNIVVTLRIALI